MSSPSKKRRFKPRSKSDNRTSVEQLISVGDLFRRTFGDGEKNYNKTPPDSFFVQTLLFTETDKITVSCDAKYLAA